MSKFENFIDKIISLCTEARFEAQEHIDNISTLFEPKDESDAIQTKPKRKYTKRK